MQKNLRKLIFIINLHSLNSTDGLWCNGNTTVFWCSLSGSSPCEPTSQIFERLFLYKVKVPFTSYLKVDWTDGMVQIFTNASGKKCTIPVLPCLDQSNPLLLYVKIDNTIFYLCHYK
jgi:hypothetical protein